MQLIGARLFLLIWTSYLDDSPQLDVMASGGDAKVAAERLLDLLSWTFSAKPEKRLDFAKTFGMQGVVF